MPRDQLQDVLIRVIKIAGMRVREVKINLVLSIFDQEWCPFYEPRFSLLEDVFRNVERHMVLRINIVCLLICQLIGTDLHRKRLIRFRDERKSDLVYVKSLHRR